MYRIRHGSKGRKNSGRSKVHRLFCIILAMVIPLGGQEFTVLFTSSLNGNLDGCNCRQNPKSGLVKRGYFLSEYRKKNRNFILLESGDVSAIETVYLKETVTVGGTVMERPIKEPYIFQAYRYLKYDAIAMGDQDIGKGVDYFLSEAATLPYVNANVKLKTANGTTAFGAPYIMKNVGGVHIAVIGITAETAFRYQKQNIKDAVVLSAAAESAAAFAKEARAKGAKAVILLSHAGYDFDVALAKRRVGIDLIVSGHDQYLPVKDPDESPEREVIDMSAVDIGGVYVLSSGGNGNRVGIAAFTAGANIVMKKFSLEYIDYTTSRDDATIRAWASEEMQREMKAFEKRRLDIK